MITDREQVDLDAIEGRELDILLAEFHSGQDRLEARYDPMNRDGEPQFHWGYPAGHGFAPNYSTDKNVIFALVDWLHELIAKADEKNKDFSNKRLLGVNYLTLACRGISYGYAASFNSMLEGEWYEDRDIKRYSYSAIGSTPELAIARAIAKIGADKELNLRGR